MEQQPLIPEALIRRFRQNECTPEELSLIRKWIAGMELTDADNPISPALLAELKAKMHQQLMQDIRAASVVPMRRRRSVYRIVAAAAVLLLMVPALLLWYINRKSSNTPADQPHALIGSAKKNIIQKVTLPDGSVVWLNRQARLEYDAQTFNVSQRLVKLSGEGFFEVMPDPRKPFIVQTGELQTRVLGTAFNIEASDYAGEIRVSLVYGKVALDNILTAQTTLLTPAHTFCYSKETKTGTIVPMAVSSIQEWINGQLVFNEVPLEEAIQRIREQFSLSIEADRQLLQDKRITAAFPAGNWQPVLQKILFVHGLRYRQVQDRIIISRNQD
ncbi:MAG: FecR domain-containing protein [Candidatus Pseudobacter hemicellulosilyticus]|uniref:FecR domain-containing protein n=1 Tax=Candidatus Pseudobacter hemicellulosilyticus TaxID=3121375 RepID=A0AAJ5WQ78_9BACT|nr:MAG: FecR domain-containing protein [Pseudobacter sp.]